MARQTGRQGEQVSGSPRRTSARKATAKNAAEPGRQIDERDDRVVAASVQPPAPEPGNFASARHPELRMQSGVSAADTHAEMHDEVAAQPSSLQTPGAKSTEELEVEKQPPRELPQSVRVRQGVTGHGASRMLFFGLIAVITAFALIGISYWAG